MDEDADDGPWLALIAVVIVLLVAYGAVAIALSVSSGTNPAADAPDAQWNLNRINETHVELVHAGGEQVPKSQISLSVNGTTRYPEWRGGNIKLIMTGDTGTLQASPGSSIVLVWQLSSTDHVVLDRWENV
jgi:hypothetical protein